MAITSTFDPAAAAPADDAAPVPSRDDEERALLARARRGDAAAFRVLVERHHARALALARRVVRDPAEAEEVAQDAFLKAWTALPGFREESRFGTWLHRIVLRRALDRLDSLSTRRRREQAAPNWAGDATHPPAGAPGDARVRALVDALPSAQRAAVLLFYFEDRSIEEAARVLGTNENTMKTHLHRARAALRAAWTRAGEETP